jgi:toxin secretion/phage lysis holin
VCAIGGAIGGVILELFGAWNLALTILCVCMGIDYLSGLVVAGVFHASPKSVGGGLDSNAGWKGLFRKVATLVIVLMAHFVDVLFGTAYIRDAVVVAFTINEILSIIENCGLMGAYVPPFLLKAIDVLRRRTEPPEIPEDKKEEGEGDDQG